jgi:hypothetical protein
VPIDTGFIDKQEVEAKIYFCHEFSGERAVDAERGHQATASSRLEDCGEEC